jgi:hypothetical protein
MRQPLAAKSSLSPIAPGVLNAEIACETGPPVMARVLLITWLNYFSDQPKNLPDADALKHADQNIRDCLSHLFLRHAAVSDRLLPGEPALILPCDQRVGARFSSPMR